MAEAEFEAYIRPRRGDHIIVGQEVDVEVEICVSESHDDISLEWEIGWTASGKTDNTVVVDSGRERIDHIEADTTETWTLPFRVPKSEVRVRIRGAAV